jgi:hypothetical protein
VRRPPDGYAWVGTLILGEKKNCVREGVEADLYDRNALDVDVRRKIDR